MTRPATALLSKDSATLNTRSTQLAGVSRDVHRLDALAEDKSQPSVSNASSVDSLPPWRRPKTLPNETRDQAGATMAVSAASSTNELVARRRFLVKSHGAVGSAPRSQHDAPASMILECSGSPGNMDPGAGILDDTLRNETEIAQPSKIGLDADLSISMCSKNDKLIQWIASHGGELPKQNSKNARTLVRLKELQRNCRLPAHVADELLVSIPTWSCEV